MTDENTKAAHPPGRARLRNWQSRLAAVVSAATPTPFEWGVHDCCTFAADCVQACTGVDPMSALRGTYASLTQAARVVAQLGGLVSIAASAGGNEVHPSLAQPGDVGLAQEKAEGGASGDILCVWLGAAWHAPGPQGLRIVRPECVQRAWRLPHG